MDALADPGRGGSDGATIGEAISSRVFLVGCPRTGTTLLQCLLAAHPRIASFPETHLFTRIVAVPFPARQRRMIAYLTRAGFHEMVPCVPGEDADAGAYVDAFISILDERALARGRDIWLEKTPAHVHHLEAIHSSIARVTFVHIVRDGVATIRSLYRVMNEYPAAWGGRRSLEWCVGRWLRDTALSLGNLGRPGHQVVRYENLISRPDLVLEQLCGSLQIAYVPAMNGAHMQEAANLLFPEEEWKRRAAAPINGGDAGATPDDYLPPAARQSVELEIAALQQQLDRLVPVQRLHPRPE